MVVKSFLKVFICLMQSGEIKAYQLSLTDKCWVECIHLARPTNSKRAFSKDSASQASVYMDVDVFLLIVCKPCIFAKILSLQLGSISAAKILLSPPNLSYTVLVSVLASFFSFRLFRRDQRAVFLLQSLLQVSLSTPFFFISSSSFSHFLIYSQDSATYFSKPIWRRPRFDFLGFSIRISSIFCLIS